MALLGAACAGPQASVPARPNTAGGAPAPAGEGQPASASPTALPTLPEVRPVRAVHNADIASLQADAAAAWAGRADPAAAKQAIALWERLHSLAPQDKAVAIALARAYYFLGEAHLRQLTDADPGPMIEAFERGALAGENALVLASPAFAARVDQGDPIEQALVAVTLDGIDSLVWYAHNLTSLAIARGIPTMLLYRGRLEALAARMQALQETADYGAPHRLRGTFLAMAPAFAGGDLVAARAAFTRAIVLAPQYLPNKLALAQWLAVQTADRDLCLTLLNEIARADPSLPTEVAPEQRMAQIRAAWLAERLDRLF